jgi:hypothetical protein
MRVFSFIISKSSLLKNIRNIFQLRKKVTYKWVSYLNTQELS